MQIQLSATDNITESTINRTINALADIHKELSDLGHSELSEALEMIYNTIHNLENIGVTKYEPGEEEARRG